MAENTTVRITIGLPRASLMLARRVVKHRGGTLAGMIRKAVTRRARYLALKHDIPLTGKDVRLPTGRPGKAP